MQSGEVRPISIDDAVKLAVEQNLGIRIQRVDPQIQDTGVALARGNWAPNFLTSVSRVGANQPALGIIQPSYSNGTSNLGLGLNQFVPWGGGNYTLNWNSQRLTTTNPFSSFSPQLSSNLQFNFTQPLLRNFSVDQIRQQVGLSKKVRDLSDVNLQTVITQTLRNVKDAYWDLVLFDQQPEGGAGLAGAVAAVC